MFTVHWFAMLHCHAAWLHTLLLAHVGQVAGHIAPVLPGLTR